MCVTLRQLHILQAKVLVVPVVLSWVALSLWASAELEELQPSAEASTVVNEGERQEGRKGKKGKKKGRAAAVREDGGTSSKAGFVMDASKGTLHNSHTLLL